MYNHRLLFSERKGSISGFTRSYFPPAVSPSKKRHRGMEAQSAMPPSLSPSAPRSLLAARKLLEEPSGDSRGHTSVVRPQIACQPSPCSGTVGTIGRSEVRRTVEVRNEVVAHAWRSILYPCGLIVIFQSKSLLNSRPYVSYCNTIYQCR